MRIVFFKNSKLKFCLLLILATLKITAIAKEKETSTCILRNPPDNYQGWNFYGDQVVWVSLKNGNILGVTAMLSCDTYATANIKRFVLLPFEEVDELRYNIFGYTPIFWSFILRTKSDAALIYGTAYWYSFK